MNEISGKGSVNKLFAAQRQLREAIWMFFAQRDELAIHTVTSAAYRILNDLKEKRGRNEAADAQFTGIFYIVRDYRRGTLPVEIQDDPEIMKYIKESADQLPLITATTEFDDLQIAMNQDASAQYWSEHNEAANFLKHADRDSENLLNLDKVKNLDLLLQAGRAYIDVTGRAFVEYEILMIYTAVKNQMIYNLQEGHRKTAKLLNTMSPEEQLKACRSFIDELYEAGTVTSPK